LVFDCAEAALKLSGIELTSSQGEAFVRHYVDGLEPRVTTPRQARLYGNVLTFALPILKGEVNPVDQMLIEGIRVLYPKLYVLIRDNRELFMTRRQERGPNDTRKQQALELITAALAGTGVSTDILVARLLKVLFPRIDRKSTRLNSSHVSISYAVFCLKKKKKYYISTIHYTSPHLPIHKN